MCAYRLTTATATGPTGGRGRPKTAPDVCHLHFLTPFWSPESNPMATRSTLHRAWAMFGSAILLGEINVG